MYRFITEHEFAFNFRQDETNNIIDSFRDSNNGAYFFEAFPFGETIDSGHTSNINFRKRLGMKYITFDRIYRLSTIKEVEEDKPKEITNKIRTYV